MKKCSTAVFMDTSLNAILESLSDSVGECSYTFDKGARLVGLDLVGERLESLFSLYRISEADEKGVDLLEHIVGYWPGLFNCGNIKKADLTLLLDDILEQIGLADLRSADSLVVFVPDLDRANQDFTLELSSKWDKLSDELKYRNRFFLSEAIDWDSIQTMLESLGKTHAKDTRFFRARISEEKIEKDQIGKPPPEKAIAGRANPGGIPYLYVATDKETTHYESRAGLHEQMYIGEFVVIDTISVVSLERIEYLGPVEIQEKGVDLEEFIRYRAFLIRLSQELSRPIRKKDLDFDYIPTQYLCEYIKSLGFDGVQYQSSMNPSGSNLAIFNDDKLECIDLRVFSVDQVSYAVSETV